MHLVHQISNMAPISIFVTRDDPHYLKQEVVVIRIPTTNHPSAAKSESIYLLFHTYSMDTRTLLDLVHIMNACRTQQ